MGVSKRGGASSNSGLSAVTDTLTFSEVPAGAQVGDFGIVFVSTNSNVVNVVAPSGWTLKLGPQFAGSALEVWVYTKTLVSADLTTPPTFTLSAAGRCVGIYEAFGGVDLGVTEPVALTSTTSGASTPTTTHTVPAVTTAAANSQVYNVWTLREATTNFIYPTFPAGHTLDKIVSTGFAASPNYGMWSMTLDFADSPGGYGPYTANGGTAGVSVGISLVLKPLVVASVSVNAVRSSGSGFGLAPAVLGGRSAAVSAVAPTAGYSAVAPSVAGTRAPTVTAVAPTGSYLAVAPTAAAVQMASVTATAASGSGLVVVPQVRAGSAGTGIAVAAVAGGLAVPPAVTVVRIAAVTAVAPLGSAAAVPPLITSTRDVVVSVPAATGWGLLALPNAHVVAAELLFIPPVVLENPTTLPTPHPGNALFRHYGPRRVGVTVYLMPGDVITEVPPVSDTDAVKVFHGGHICPVTTDEAALLTAAGYSVNGYGGA